MDKNPRAKLGILMLDTHFPRIPGDVGNPNTWDFKVRYHVVKGATPQAIVCDDTRPFVDAFVAAGRTLVAEGCAGVATTCGFLALIRPQLAAQLGVPVAASALEQAAQIQAMMAPDCTLGVLTISKAALTPAHLRVAAVPPSATIIGVEDSSFARSILGNHPDLDVERARQELIEASMRCVGDAPQTGAILLECTNMVPYAPDISAATGLPVYSIYTYLNWFHQSLTPQRFPTA
ncbi:MAG: aspartate/glutamate racemase family protein [Roseobacter sp.]